MLNIILEDPKSEVLCVTPLLPGHKIRKETKIGIKRNDIPLSWISYEGQNNIPTNVSKGIAEYHKEPKFVIIIDRDIDPSRNMIKNMYDLLVKTPNQIAYCYCNFEFKGSINAKFVNIPYDPLRLLKSNYISSNSLIKYDKLKEIGGFITDNKYRRLLDWALWLKFLSSGYYGVLCTKSYFIAPTDERSVSAGSQEEYRQKYQLVHRDFIAPLTEGLIL